MTMHNYVWLCVTLYDFVWLCMTVWLCMISYDYVWICMTIYNYVWLCMTMYVYLWLCMPMFHYVRQFKLFHFIQMCSYFSTNLDFFIFVYLCYASMHSFVLVLLRPWTTNLKLQTIARSLAGSVYEQFSR